MIDRLPFPNINASTTEDQIKQLVDYLVQFKEELEFALVDIGVDNLSADLLKKLQEGGGSTQTQTKVESVSVYELISSPAFKASVPTEYIKSAKQKEASTEDGGVNLLVFTNEKDEEIIFRVLNGKTPRFSINYETGDLEYE